MSRKMALVLKATGFSLLVACLVGCGGDTPPGVATTPSLSQTPEATQATPSANASPTRTPTPPSCPAPQSPTTTPTANPTPQTCSDLPTPSDTPLVPPTATPTCACPATPPPAAARVGVSGNSFTLNGAAWIPKAFNIAGFVSTRCNLMSLKSQAKYNGYVADTTQPQALFDAIEMWGADTVRFLVSQYYLNPKSVNAEYYDPNYFCEVVSIISQARSQGLIVEIAMQDEAEGGGPQFHGLPTAETLQAWLALNGVFGGDEGVMYELYNEPTQGEIPACKNMTPPPDAPPSAEEWDLWLRGGCAYYPPGHQDPFVAVGMQTMIDTLRNAGSMNTFVLDGLKLATSINGAPLPCANPPTAPCVSDPLNRVAYGIHQYLSGHCVDEANWTSNFGQYSSKVAIFVDEWFACANSKPGLLGLNDFQPAVDFLNYLRGKGIGIGGWAIDVAGYMVNDVPGWQDPSYYAGGSPSEAPLVGDAGVLIINDFLADYGRTLTPEDGTTLYMKPTPSYPATPCST